MKLDKTKYEEDIMDQRKEEEERLLIVMVNPVNFPFPWAAFIFILNFTQTWALRPPYSTAVFFFGRASKAPFFLLIVTIGDFKERRLGPRVINMRLKETSGGGWQACLPVLHPVTRAPQPKWIHVFPVSSPTTTRSGQKRSEVSIRPKPMTFVRWFVRSFCRRKKRKKRWLVPTKFQIREKRGPKMTSLKKVNFVSVTWFLTEKSSRNTP